MQKPNPRFARNLAYKTGSSGSQKDLPEITCLNHRLLD